MCSLSLCLSLSLSLSAQLFSMSPPPPTPPLLRAGGGLEQKDVTVPNTTTRKIQIAFLKDRTHQTLSRTVVRSKLSPPPTDSHQMDDCCFDAVILKSGADSEPVSNAERFLSLSPDVNTMTAKCLCCRIEQTAGMSVSVKSRHVSDFIPGPVWASTLMLLRDDRHNFYKSLSWSIPQTGAAAVLAQWSFDSQKPELGNHLLLLFSGFWKYRFLFSNSTTPASESTNAASCSIDTK